MLTDAVHLFFDSVRQLSKENIFPPKTSKTLCSSMIKNEDGMISFSSRTRWKTAERLLAKIKQVSFFLNGIFIFVERNSFMFGCV